MSTRKLLEGKDIGEKLEGNGLFESSRFIMPQHREALNEQARLKLLKPRPELDPQELDFIAQAIGESYSQGTSVSLELYNEYEEKIVTGVVVGLEQSMTKVKLQTADEIEDIEINSIIGLK